MIKEYKEMFPKCIEENRGLILSNDIDSLFSCYMLNKIKGLNITHFYDFKHIYDLNNSYNKDKLIGVDIDFVEYPCWGNHTTYNYNPKCANINNLLRIGINRNYTEKFCVSTLLTIISYFDYDISHLNEEQKQVLLCIDSTYKGYRFNKKLFSQYMIDFGLEELLDTVENTSNNTFEYIRDKYNLNGNIKVKDGQLITNIKLGKLSKLFNIDLCLPINENVEIIETFKTKYLKIWDYEEFKENNTIISQAQIYRDSISLTYC